MNTNNYNDFIQDLIDLEKDLTETKFDIETNVVINDIDETDTKFDVDEENSLEYIKKNNLLFVKVFNEDDEKYEDVYYEE